MAKKKTECVSCHNKMDTKTPARLPQVPGAGFNRPEPKPKAKK